MWHSTIKVLSIKTDFLIASSTPLTVGIPASIKKWVHKTPYFFETRDVWPETPIAVGAIKNPIFQWVLYRLEQLIYNNSLAIIPLSTDMKKNINKRYPQTIDKTVVIENISEINRFQDSYNKNRYFLKEKLGFEPRFSILYAGTFGLVNGLDYVVRLADKILKIDKTIIFILIGEGKERETVMNKARSIK